MLKASPLWGKAELYGIPKRTAPVEGDTRLSKDERVTPGTWRTAPKGPLPVDASGNVVIPPGMGIKRLKTVVPKPRKARVTVAGIEVAVAPFDPHAAERDAMDREQAEQFALYRANGTRLIGGTY